MGLLASLITGAIIGWLAGKVMNRKHGLIMNIIIGILGGSIGGFIFRAIGLSVTGWGGYVITGVVGACVLIWIVKRI